MFSSCGTEFGLPPNTQTDPVSLGLPGTNDPMLELGWKQEYFSDPETDWVRREMRIFEGDKYSAAGLNESKARCDSIM